MRLAAEWEDIETVSLLAANGIDANLAGSVSLWRLCVL